MTLDIRQLITREPLIRAIAEYQTVLPGEHSFRRKFLELLVHPRAFFRDHLPGHITASAWIIDETREWALLTHHAKLNRWLQPGGHADGEEDVLAVAKKEALEETGLTSLHVMRGDIFDLDIHPIPARGNFPAHFHYDIRFLFQADKAEKFTVTPESHDLAWVSSKAISARTGNNLSILRMAEKSLHN